MQVELHNQEAPIHISFKKAVKITDRFEEFGNPLCILGTAEELPKNPGLVMHVSGK